MTFFCTLLSDKLYYHQDKLLKAWYCTGLVFH